jgi:NADH-quinone oxidoreductase subunit K
MVPLEWYLVLAAALFCVGAYGVLSRRDAIAILMGIELMLNAININMVAFWRYLGPAARSTVQGSAAAPLYVKGSAAATAGQAFPLFVYAVAAAEATVGLALIIALWRRRGTTTMETVDLSQG